MELQFGLKIGKKMAGKVQIRNLVKNKDLWVLLNKATEKKLIVWKWVKAHAGNKYNELADKLATEAINN